MELLFEIDLHDYELGDNGFPDHQREGLFLMIVGE